MAMQLTGYDLGLIKISTQEILSYTKERSGRGDYSLGGFYMIKNIKNDMAYIGKSLNPLKRLRSHYYNAKRNSGIYIDTQMHGHLDDFEFYLISFYVDMGIDFFTKRMEIQVEQQYIKKFNTCHPFGYNIQVYESISA